MTLDFLCLVRYNSKALGTLAQLVEHIVHIDGVTGSSPVATTMNPSNLWIRGISLSKKVASCGLF